MQNHSGGGSVTFVGLEAQYLIEAIDALERQMDRERAAFNEDPHVIIRIEERRKILQNAKFKLNKLIGR